MSISFNKINSNMINPFKVREKNVSVDTKLSSLLPKETKKSVKYVLEGGIIKVYETDANGVEKCVKMISIHSAKLEVLNKVECSSLSDMMLLNEAKQEKSKEKGSGSCSGYNG